MALLLGLLPLILRIAGYIFDKADASEETRKQFLDLIAKGKDDALTPIQRKDELTKLKAELIASMKEGK